jgi:hypothetical protein
MLAVLFSRSKDKTASRSSCQRSARRQQLEIHRVTALPEAEELRCHRVVADAGAIVPWITWGAAAEGCTPGPLAPQNDRAVSRRRQPLSERDRRAEPLLRSQRLHLRLLPGLQVPEIADVAALKLERRPTLG